MGKTNFLSRKITIIFFLLFTSIISSYAVKAYKGITIITQPDGTQLSIRIHGDEFFKYRTTVDGYLISQNEAGYYVYASADEKGKIIASSQIAKNAEQRTVSDASFLKTMPESIIADAPRSFKSKAKIQGPRRAYPLTGSPKSLVILANFSDKSFKVSNPLTSFQNLCTQSGYSVNGATGSAKDYFISSSYGKFSPDFVVVGPVTLPKTLAYYGANDSYGNDLYPDQMIADACTAADAAGVDFTQYDTDNDGYIDNVFVYYAGYNEAEGAAANTIWPHRWSLDDAGFSGTRTFDGKILNDYSCTSELKGASGTTICGIGTFCHEFGHVLGLPDYYHTTADKTTLETWSIMDYGPYLNDGNTPPAYSAYDRFYLGFLAPEVKNTAANLTLQPLFSDFSNTANTNQQAYLLSAGTFSGTGMSPNPTEFFITEYRKHTGWDTYLGQEMLSDGSFGAIPSDGMCIWHIDYKKSIWEDDNAPNNYTGTTQTSSSHMRVYLQPLSGSTTTPGTTFTSGSFTPKTWSGTNINREITEITKNTDNMTFKLMGGVVVSSAKITVGVVENSLTFPAIAAGKTKAKNINIKTTSITGDLTAKLTGTNASSFTITTDQIAQATANGAGYDLLITFAPAAAGAYSAVLTISGGGLTSDKVINLVGTAN